LLTLEHRSKRLILIPATFVIVLGLLLVQIRSAPETHPWGDTAITSINTLRAARGNLAEGTYSRFHWNHPGPLLYQVLAPLYVLSGQREISIKWTVLMLNIAALGGLLFVVWRRAPLLSVLVALALAPLLYREQRLLFWAWNPIVPLLPFAFATALSAGIATGTVAFLPLFVATASLIVQAHIGFAPLVLSLAATSSAALAWRLSRSQSAGERSEFLRRAAVAAIVLLVLWAVPIAHEFSTPHGNLATILEFFRSAAGPTRSWGTAFEITANQLLGPFTSQWQVTTTTEAPADASWAILALAGIQFPLLLAAGLFAFRRAASFEGTFALTLLVASTTGLFAVASIVGPVSDYLVVWLPVLGALNLAVIANEAVQGGSGARRDLPGAWRWVVVAYTVGAAVMGATRLVGKHATDARSPTVEVLTTNLEEYCRREGIERPLLRFSGPAWQAAVGVVLQFYKERRPIALPDDMVFLVGDPFKATGHEPAEFYVMMDDETTFPQDVTRHVWLTTFGSYRLVRVFRD
jgi:hypothetical protein